MVSLKRSFLYTLVIFCFLAFIIYLALYFTPKQKVPKRTKINPAQYISKKEKPVQMTAGSQQPQKEQPPVKKEKKVQTKKPKEQDPKRSAPTKSKERPTIPTIEKERDLNLPEKNDELIKNIMAGLSEPVEAKPQLSQQEQMLNEVYGDEVTRLSTTAKKYLLDNHLKMQIITQRVLNRMGRVYIDPRFHYYAHNYVEFMLYPDGHISEIKILKDAGFKLLDRITQETIETAYKDYPLPKEPTLIRYKFLYDLRSY